MDNNHNLSSGSRGTIGGTQNNSDPFDLNLDLGKASKKKSHELGTLSQQGGRGSDTPN